MRLRTLQSNLWRTKSNWKSIHLTQTNCQTCQKLIVLSHQSKTASLQSKEKNFLLTQQFHPILRDKNFIHAAYCSERHSLPTYLFVIICSRYLFCFWRFMSRSGLDTAAQFIKQKREKYMGKKFLWRTQRSSWMLKWN